jgi:MFS family permease
LLSSVVFYLSKFYTRSEVASRIGIFYAGAAAASAFGGLLAYGIFHIQGGRLYSWSYLFILEGCLTCLAAIISYFVLPGEPAHAWFLAPSERKVVEARIMVGMAQEECEGKEFSWSEAIQQFKTVHIYARALIAVCYGVLPASSANFLAIMVNSLGYSVTKTNLVSSFDSSSLMRNADFP